MSIDTIISCPCCGQTAAVKRPLVDLTSNTVSWNGSLKVAPQEAEFLHILSKSFGRPARHEAVVAGLYGGGDSPLDTRHRVRRISSNLRKRLPAIGLTIKGQFEIGPALVPCSDEAAHAAA
jgi:DNA-binding response OmpR family regulator